MFISEDTIISLLGLKPAQRRQCQWEARVPCQPWCPCCSLPTWPLQSQHCYPSPVVQAPLHRCSTHHPLPLLWPEGSLGHTTLCWLSLEPTKLFKAYTVPPSWRWFWLLQCLLTPGKMFNSFSTFSFTEGEEDISIFNDKKARDSRSHWLQAFSYTLYISWH